MTHVSLQGCFWGIQELFTEKFESFGVKSQVVYAGAMDHAHPTYDDLGNHAEALLIRFDPEFIKYHELVKFFFQCHDPTEKNR